MEATSMESGKQRCRAVVNRIETIPSSTNISVSAKQTLLKSAFRELNFLSRSSSPSSSSLSLNIGHLEAILHVLHQPSVTGVSRVCKPISNSKAVYVDIICTLNRNPVWVIVSDRNPKYVSWFNGRRSKGLKSRLEELVRFAQSLQALKPCSIVLFFSRGIDCFVSDRIQGEFGASECSFEFSDFDFGFSENLDGDWVNVISRSYKEARVFEIKVSGNDCVVRSSKCNAFTDVDGPEIMDEQLKRDLGDSFCSIVMAMHSSPLCGKDSASLENLSGGDDDLMNFDTTALIALVSGISNGCVAKLLGTPESELRQRFKGNYDFVIGQAMSETEKPILAELSSRLFGKRGIICESVHSEFNELVAMCGGPNEKSRANQLLKHIMVVPDRPSKRMMCLPTTRKMALKNKVVFGTGDYWNAPTLTANMAFVRAVSQTEFKFNASIHSVSDCDDVNQCPSMAAPLTSITPTINSFFFFLFCLYFSITLQSSPFPHPTSFSPNFSSPLFQSQSYVSSNHKLMDSKNDSGCLEHGAESSLKCVFGAIDADFFSNNKMNEVLKGAKEFNVPVIRANRKLVASDNGGLHNPSPLIFNPKWKDEKFRNENRSFSYPPLSGIHRPKNEEDIAFMSVLELGELIKTKQMTSQELTRIFLQRLKRYNNVLEAVVTFTEELAYKQAKEADDLFARGVYLGPLHGIPYGLKDIISVPGYRTTWSSKSFEEQVIDIEAWVYKKLKSAGAVLVAKLVSGSLAYDDIWFGGRTRNPWNIEEFSTGSSAGPSACTSAGMVPFAIGSETAGSMTYPAARCGVTALRPTFGTVGRSGVMSISESLDKLGPFCRNAVDCSVILDVIRGKDPYDVSSVDSSLEDPFSVNISELIVGYLDDADMGVVQILSSKGVNMVPFKLNYTVDSVQGILNFTMDVDMLAHFDEWQRLGLDDEYEAQDQWPTELRRARAITAVDYLQAQRARGKLIREVRESFTVDAFIGNATDWERVCLGNLVGLPVIVIPTGLKNISNPPPSCCSRRRTTITTGIYAPPHKDHIALALAMAYQSVTDHHKKRPPIDNLGPDDSIPNPPSISIPPRLLHL